MTSVNVRYMVDDVVVAVAFYTTQLGFTLDSSAAPVFSDVTRGARSAPSRAELRHGRSDIVARNAVQARIGK